MRSVEVVWDLSGSRCCANAQCRHCWLVSFWLGELLLTVQYLLVWQMPLKVMEIVYIHPYPQTGTTHPHNGTTLSEVLWMNRTICSYSSMLIQLEAGSFYPTSFRSLVPDFLITLFEGVQWHVVYETCSPWTTTTTQSRGFRHWTEHKESIANTM